FCTTINLPMHKKILPVLLFISLFCYLPVVSMAWGMLGHRIVGGIAETYLTSKAKMEIRRILGNESIAMASNWADFIKSDTSYRYISPWHYVNFAKDLSYTQMQDFLKTDTATDAYTRLNFLVKELKKKNLSKEKKVMYLKLLIHIAEDLSQPMHVSPVGTTGGNDIKLNWFNTPSNLHRVWDEHLIEYQQLSYTEYIQAINFPTALQLKKWKKEPIAIWLYDSYSQAQKLQSEITGTNPRLSYEYNYNHVKQLNEQLLKGGIRLAGLLNSIFDK
ncbi:MAG TPA: S1/P1 nuclease, partial [Flavisolibacter sp.]|nr:S1/P1 nuclease [Flavisolibacter sp.]